MKHTTFIVIILSLTSQMLHSQDLVQKKYIVFKTTVIDVHNGRHKGFLATLDDSTLFMTQTIFALTFEKVHLDGFQKLNYSEINKVSLQRKGSIGRGLIFGGAGGLLVGVIAGANEPVQAGYFSSWIQSSNAIIGAIIGGGVGCFLGSVISALSHKIFVIRGRKDKLIKMQETMINKLY